MGNRLLNRIKDWLCALIPGKVKTGTVVSVMELMRRFQTKRKKDYSFHLLKNEETFLSHREQIGAAGGFVEDQLNYVDMWFGSCTMKHAGCEIIAAYNALVHMKESHLLSFSQMIDAFEKDGMLRSGRYGTSPKAVRDFFDRAGFQTFFTTKEQEFEEVAELSDSLILTLFNDKHDIRKEVHTVSVTKENGTFTVHNLYGNGVVEGPYSGMKELMDNINGGNAKGISLLGIKRQN